MKRFLAIVLLAFVISANAFAQKEECQWTLNTRAWTTNYFASLIYDVATSFVKQFVFDMKMGQYNHPKESMKKSRKKIKKRKKRKKNIIKNKNKNKK